jgi:large subunit ribosomal protein L25
MKLEIRTERLSEIRNKNLVPGVMYGKSIDSTNVQVDKQELFQALETYGKSMTFKVRLDNKYHHVYIKNVQSRVLKPKDILHFDLHRVTAKETFSSQIPIHVINQEKFIGGSEHVELMLNEVTAEYTPGSGMSSIEVDVSTLVLGDKVLVKDLKISKDMSIKNNQDDMVLMIKETRVVEEPEETDEIIEIETVIEEENEDK